MCRASRSRPSNDNYGETQLGRKWKVQFLAPLLVLPRWTSMPKVVNDCANELIQEVLR